MDKGTQTKLKSTSIEIVEKIVRQQPNGILLSAEGELM
jgi:hypothetical protein